MNDPTKEDFDHYHELIDDLIVESDEDYNSQRDDNVTGSSIKDFIKNQKLYYLKHVTKALVKDELEVPHISNLTRTTVLEGPKEAMTKSATAIKIRGAVMEHLIGLDLLSVGQAQRVVRMNWLGLPVQIKMDYITPFGIIKFITTDNIDNFYNYSGLCDVNKFGYLVSAAFSRAILHHFNPSVPKQDFYFIVSGKEEPYTVGVWKVDNRVLDIYERMITKAMDELKEARETNRWIDPYEELRFIDA